MPGGGGGCFFAKPDPPPAAPEEGGLLFSWVLLYQASISLEKSSPRSPPPAPSVPLAAADEALGLGGLAGEDSGTPVVAAAEGTTSPLEPLAVELLGEESDPLPPSGPLPPADLPSPALLVLDFRYLVLYL